MRATSQLGLVDAFDFEVEALRQEIGARLRRHAGYQALQTIPGVGAAFAAIFVAEIGDVTRFAGPPQLCSWAGLTPRHHESDTTVRRGHITTQGSTLARWAPVEAVQVLPINSKLCADRERIAARRGPQHRQGRRGPAAAHPGLLRSPRQSHPLPAQGRRVNRQDLAAGRVLAAGHDPHPVGRAS